MVKAFGYGAGLTEVAGFLQHENVDYLGVAYVDEAIELRKKGIRLPIMIMNPGEIDFGLFHTYDLDAEIYSLEALQRLIESRYEVGIHLKLETGMNRLGFAADQVPRLITLLKENPQIQVKGIFTHFSSSDSAAEDAFTHLQAKKFITLKEEISRALGITAICHCVNSPGIVRFPDYHFDMVRLGIGLYGFDPTGQLLLEKPTVFNTYISQLKQLQKGETVGYSRKGHLEQNAVIAVLPVGYADGYRRAFGNGRAFVSINGQQAPTVGNICMDMTMINVSDLDISLGDEVILFGVSPSIEDLANWSDTIPYEILTGISERVKRTYVRE